jgi:PIN domain nuclease of toxin-antitoxin system
VLLDTHTLIWAINSPDKLGTTAVSVHRDPANELVIGVGAVWEISIKVSVKKLDLTLPYRAWVNGAIAALGLRVLPISLDHCEVQSALQRHHGDPFDRLLIAQSIVEAIPIVGNDPLFVPYGISLIW